MLHEHILGWCRLQDHRKSQKKEAQLSSRKIERMKWRFLK